MAEGEKRVRVGVQYDVDGNADRRLTGIAGAAQKAGGAVGGLTSRFGAFRQEVGLNSAALLGVGFGLGAWVNAAKQANAEQAKAIKGLAALYSTSLAWDENTSATERYARSLTLARENFEQLDEIGDRFAVDGEAVAAAYRTLGIAAAPLGLTQKQLLDLTTKTVAAAKVYGVEGTDAANKIAKALQGGPISRADDFGKALFSAVGKIKKGNPAKTFDEFSRALEGFAGQADMMSQGLGDNLKRIQDTVQDLARDLTKPMFAEMAKTMGDVAAHLKEAGASGAPRIAEYAQELVVAFREVAKLSKLVFDHWQEIALLWGGSKVVGFLGALGAAFGTVGTAAAASKAALASSAALAGSVAAVVYTAYKDNTTEGKARRQSIGDLSKGVLPSINPGFEQDLKMTVDLLRGSRVLGERGQIVDREALVSALTMNEKQMLRFGEQLGINQWQIKGNDPRSAALAVTAAFEKSLAGMIAKNPEVLGTQRPAPATEEKNADKDRKFVGKPETNIENLELKVSFEDVDPERVWTKLVDDLNEQVGRRTQSNLTHHDLE